MCWLTRGQWRPFMSVDQQMWVGHTKEQVEKLVSCLIPKFWIFSKWGSIWITPCPSLMMALISLPPVTFTCLCTRLVISFYWLGNFCVHVCATSHFVHHWFHWSYRFHLYSRVCAHYLRFHFTVWENLCVHVYATSHLYRSVPMIN